MMYQAPHDEWLEKILEKLSGELSSSDLVALNDHLASCSNCTEAMRDYELLAAYVATIVSDQPSSPLSARMLALKAEIAQSTQAKGEKLLAVSLRPVSKNSTEEVISNRQYPLPIQKSEKSSNKRGPEPGSRKAKHGGQAVREKYGPEFYSRIGKKGGETVKEKRGPQFYAEIGKKGGESTKRQQGSEFHSRIGKKGGERGGIQSDGSELSKNEKK